MFFTTELSGTIGYLSPSITLPEGLMVLAAAMALTTSSGERLQARSRSGLMLTTMARALPPKGGGAETPGNVANSGERDSELRPATGRRCVSHWRKPDC